MIRTLLTTTAIALALSTTAMAQTTNEMAPADSMAPANEMAPADSMAPAGDAMAPANEMAPAGDAMAPAADTTEMAPADDAMATDDAMAARTPLDMAAGYAAGDGDAIVSAVMGAPIYSSAADDAEEIGSVNDLVINADGQVNAVVIGVGGFLGIGEKNVAVDFTELEYTMAADNTARWVLPTTAEALTAAPDFVWEDPMAPAADAVATDPAMDPAMAPADPGAVSETPAM
jgi:sporulation protein YlmC with PRC-barrel domain